MTATIPLPSPQSLLADWGQDPEQWSGKAFQDKTSPAKTSLSKMIDGQADVTFTGCGQDRVPGDGTFKGQLNAAQKRVELTVSGVLYFILANSQGPGKKQTWIGAATATPIVPLPWNAEECPPPCDEGEGNSSC